MSNLTNPTLIYFIACPDCSGDLIEVENHLKCAYCCRKYEIRNGIPLLYHNRIDFEHLREEENLAKMMKRPLLSRKDQFSSVQWQKSKQEFWGMVRDNIKSHPKSFINIGCGYDSFFSQFESDGYVFVNFDIVYDMLYTLQMDRGAKSCVAGDINSLPFKKNIFDYVVSIDVTHHEYDNLPILLGSLANLLKPGGILFLEDPNAWGMFQLAKSALFSKPLYRILRSTYHKLKHSTHKPADYEFPTSVWHVKNILDDLGFHNIKVYPNNAYPNIGPWSYQFYKLFNTIEWVQKYHNYHYMLSAVKK